MALVSSLRTKPAVAPELDQFVINQFSIEVPNRGAVINLPLHSKLPSESSLADPAVIATLPSDGSAGQGIMQVFRASKNNINTALVSLAGASLSNIEVDNFDYGSTTILRQFWVSSDLTNTPVSLDLASPYAGAGAMAISFSKTGSIGDHITRSFSTALNVSASAGLSFYMTSQVSGSSNSWRFSISDGTNTAYIDFFLTAANIWELKSFAFSTFVGIANINRASIVDIRLTLLSISASRVARVDRLELFGGAGGSILVDASLYSFGSSLPTTTQGSLNLLDSGVSSIGVEVFPSKSVCRIPLQRGVLNTAYSLTPGNFYGIHLAKPSEGFLQVYGYNSQFYAPGNVYITNGGSITAVNKSFGFAVLATGTSQLLDLSVTCLGEPGFSKIFLYSINSLTGSGRLISEFSLACAIGRELLFGTGNFDKLLVNRDEYLMLYYQDGLNSTVSRLCITAKHAYQAFPTYG